MAITQAPDPGIEEAAYEEAIERENGEDEDGEGILGHPTKIDYSLTVYGVPLFTSRQVEALPWPALME